MDLRAHQESSLSMPIPMSYGSIHESSKFRMLSSPHGHGSSSLNGSLHSSTPISRSAMAPAALPSSGPQPSSPAAPAPAITADEQLSQSRMAAPSSTPAPSGSVGGPSTSASEQIITPSSSMTPGLPLSLASKKPVRYRECLKNHAANMGGHALDGCGEFMPSGEDGSLEALKCAACGCHRNFHRREGEGDGGRFCYTARAGMMMKDRRRFGPALPLHTPLELPPSSMVPRAISQEGALPLRMAVLHSCPPNAGDDNHHPPDLHIAPHHHSFLHHHFGHSASMKKRFRTKFDSEQKDKMCAFAEKLGWRIQKHNETAVHQFCADVGVKRHVFKVWMHNNKNTFSKKISPTEGRAAYLDNGGSASPTTTSSGMQA